VNLRVGLLLIGLLEALTILPAEPRPAVRGSEAVVKLAGYTTITARKNAALDVAITRAVTISSRELRNPSFSVKGRGRAVGLVITRKWRAEKQHL
jgi:hypothetical protein